jgi:hypothetical protein
LQIRERGAIVEAEDVPGLHWLLALLFIGVGGLVVAGALGLFVDAQRLPPWQRALAVGFGAVGLVAGFWTLDRSPRSRLTVDPGRGRLRLEQRGIGRRSVREWPLASLRVVELIEDRDDEGGEVFRLQLVLHEGEPVLVSPVWRDGREAMEAVARRVARAARVNTVTRRDG